MSKTVIIVLSVIVGICAVCGVVGIGFSTVISNGKMDFDNQCDSAIGEDPSATATATTATKPKRADDSEPSVPATSLTANPYAELTLDPGDDHSDYVRDCVSAMPTAPHQREALTGTNAGFAAECAGRLAMSQASGSGPAMSGQADMVRQVIYWASSGSVTGQCDPSVGAVSESSTLGCGALDPEGRPRALALPTTVREQGYCGQRVERSAISPGDLVFWDFDNHAASRVGIAVSESELVTYPDGGGSAVLQPVSSDSGVRVKRVLVGD